MGSLELIDFDDKEKWNHIVKSFNSYDVYYLNEYVSAFRHANDGKPLLVYFYGNRMRLCYVVQQSDIADDTRFSEYLSQGEYYDWSTPYGYGGPLAEDVDGAEVADFFDLLGDYCSKNQIVSQFIRFHPLLQNQLVFEANCSVRKLKQTVFMDTSDKQSIAINMDAKNRNMVKKAEKSGIEIMVDNSDEAISAFVELYRGTMERNQASQYYYFNSMFFDDLFVNLKGSYSLFHAKYEGEIISSAIIMHSNGSMHYHLSASQRSYMHLAPNNLLLYAAACWGADNGYERFHLGGGVAAVDSLLSFKKSFNKHGLIDFYIGRSIFCEDSYKKLLDIRSASSSDFKADNNHMIQYRA
ncbi:GNAT family N-acetyltransferase [Paenibacillus sp. CF384]|uniref:GNAT family N-acetyltransferase n=1 Tax=Paenibacillus sp. CF384 TaxID=1884382 RepID=UPI00089650E6|nr:GNAT family N-acetyltransferase [Paenibacillus sp. CF384]SDX28670.1 Lipid II:glycine glycyltransferase (Peptidoglycan interpeptide bridge formation enzyme) [Paenibacillus sp. CF384]